MTNQNFVTSTTYDSWKKPCHTGNTRLYTEPYGGSLFIGGWNNAATFDWNTHVIDLTGSELKFASVPTAYDDVSKQFLAITGRGYAGWLSLPFPDYKTPENLKTYAQWKAIADLIRDILKDGKDVLVACHGGHGRSGLFCSIVGYILAVNSDRSWSSPVEKIRGMHCDDAVETIAQEQYVYDILGLDIKIKRQYVETVGTAWKYKACPICNTQSTFVDDLGMCLGCEKKYKELAPVRTEMTAADLKHEGEVDHSCKDADCIGIWKAKECGHTVHNKIVVNGLCQTCYNHEVAEQQYAEQKLENTESETLYDPCAICEKNSWYADKFGVCYECSQDLADSPNVDWVHNSITDPYRALPHKCNDIGCLGVIIADVCGHVVHNQDVEDGYCPTCLELNKKSQEDYRK